MLSARPGAAFHDTGRCRNIRFPPNYVHWRLRTANGKRMNMKRTLLIGIALGVGALAGALLATAGGPAGLRQPRVGSTFVAQARHQKRE